MTSHHARESRGRLRRFAGDPAAESTVDLRLSDPAGVIDAIPYLLGFHPAESLVVLGIDGCRLVVTVRMDLADVSETRLVSDAIGAVARAGATAVIAAVFTAESPVVGAPLPWAALEPMLIASTARFGCSVTELLMVSRGRWWSYLCHEAPCCPPEGRQLVSGSSEVAAEATFAGMVALPDRACLAAILDPRSAAEHEALLPLIEAAEHAAVQAVLDGASGRHQRAVKRALFAAARAADRAAPPEPAPEPAAVELAAPDPVPAVSAVIAQATVAWFGVALSDVVIRDAVWMAVDDGRLDGRQLWRELAQRLPSPYDATALFLFGWASWRAGNGALAGIAAQRAIDSDPGYTAADLLLAALARGLDPRQLPKLRLPRTA